MKIIIEPYSHDWARAYRQLRDVYIRQLNGLHADIQHVGSTSVEGLPAKAVLDIDLIVEAEDLMPPVIGRLQDLGYAYRGTMGIPGRHALAADSSNVPFSECDGGWMRHQLYVCVRGSVAVENHIRFRDYLRSHPEARDEYGSLKRRLAEVATSMDWYVAQKTDFITDVLRRCGLSGNAIEEIRNANK